ncbi:MAG: hypothetical protein KA436_04595 [Oligoflexales bacterium]|nr:hypothetical protein [Oligoflexales bacterium]
MLERLRHFIIEKKRPDSKSGDPLSSALSVRYNLLIDEELRDKIFLKLKHSIYTQFKELPREHSSAPLFYESGLLAFSRRYFYLRPRNTLGWLFEQSPHGWLVSQSEKIVDQDVFMRKGQPFDLVNIYEPQQVLTRPRVHSSLFEDEGLMTLSTYQRLLLKSMLSTA